MNHTLTQLLADRLPEIMGELYTPAAPAETLSKVIELDKNARNAFKNIIQRAHNAESGKICVSKKGKCRDENGWLVESFCVRVGEVDTGEDLYSAIAVFDLKDSVALLLVRSDVNKPLAKLFPRLGTAQDWSVMEKCAKRFSPKDAYRRLKIEVEDAQQKAASTNARAHMTVAGCLHSLDVEVLSGMEAAKLQLVDLATVAAIFRRLSQKLAPDLVHVLRVKNADDLDELRRVLKALDLTAPASAQGHDVPIIELAHKTDLQCWLSSRQFILLTYQTAVLGQYFIDFAERSRFTDFKKYPCPPTLIGKTVWSNRACVEIDTRGLRFSDEELRVGRKLIATLIASADAFLITFEREWEVFCRGPEAPFTPYAQAWFRSFHLSAAQVLFSGYQDRMSYIELCRQTDAARLRLREDREERYQAALKKLKGLTGKEERILAHKPKTKAEAQGLLKQAADAFPHQVGGAPVLCFTADSLIRFAGIEIGEFDDFVLKLKSNKLIEHKSHPVTFANREQARFTCVRFQSDTVTAEVNRKELLSYEKE